MCHRTEALQIDTHHPKFSRQRNVTEHGQVLDRTLFQDFVQVLDAHVGPPQNNELLAPTSEQTESTLMLLCG